jgi:gas vesicle protein
MNQQNFLLGFGLGLMGGLLLAPKSGSETRSMIKHKAMEGGERVREKASHGIDYLKEQAGEVKVRAGRMVGKPRYEIDESGTVATNHGMPQVGNAAGQPSEVL